jgi:predicted transcriptional regulator
MKSTTRDDLVTDPIDDETRAAILEGLTQARRGEFVPDKEIEALWRRNGVSCAKMKP